MKIWHDGDLQCSKCGKMGFILDWEFDCGSHGENGYLGANTQRLFYCLNCLSELEKMPMNYIWQILHKIESKNS